jgi:hypothetical protein
MQPPASISDLPAINGQQLNITRHSDPGYLYFYLKKYLSLTASPRPPLKTVLA